MSARTPEDRIDLRLTRPDARKLGALARADGRTKPEMLRTLIRRAFDLARDTPAPINETTP